jgi:hypothetical protein
MGGWLFKGDIDGNSKKSEMSERIKASGERE